MEEDGGSWDGILEIFNHAFEIESLGLLVEISIVSNLEATSLKNAVMVSPCW